MDDLSRLTVALLAATATAGAVAALARLWRAWAERLPAAAGAGVPTGAAAVGDTVVAPCPSTARPAPVPSGVAFGGWWVAAGALTSALLVLAALGLGRPGLAPAWALLGPVLALATWIDLAEHRLPDRLTMPALAAQALLVTAASLGAGEGGRWLVGGLVGAVVLALPLFVVHLVTPQGLGFGDVKLGLVLGLAAGAAAPVLALWSLVAAAVVGTVWGLVVALRARSMRAAFPFGPALALGTVLTLALAGLP